MSRGRTKVHSGRGSNPLEPRWRRGPMDYRFFEIHIEYWFVKHVVVVIVIDVDGCRRKETKVWVVS